MGIQQMLLGTKAPLVVSVSPSILSGSGSMSTVDTTGTATVTASGGSGSYTYSWQFVSGDAGISPILPTNASTPFRATGMVVSEVRIAVFRCEVSDGTGVAYTGNVSVTLTRT